MSRAEEIRAVEPMTDGTLRILRGVIERAPEAPVSTPMVRRLLARLDRAEAALATADAAGFARGVEAASAAVDGLWSNGSTPYARGRREMKIAAIDAISALLPPVTP